MTYALLLAPHLNARYFESLKMLALRECTLLSERLSACGNVRFEEIAGMQYLCFDGELNPEEVGLVYRISSAYVLFEAADGQFRPLPPTGEKLQEIEEMRSVLKYKGKTNEVFTSSLLNLALLSGDFWKGGELSLLDPMCGRGTTLFTALGFGFTAHGIEIDETDVKEIRNFLSRFTRFHRWKYKENTSSLTYKGREGGIRYAETFAPDAETMKARPFRFDVVQGNTVLAAAYYKPESMHVIVGDLPYGIQHAAMDGQKKGSSDRLMRQALPQWHTLLKKGGTIALSFNTYAVTLEQIRAMLREAGFEVLEGETYDRFAHWVEQAVNRDIVIGRKG